MSDILGAERDPYDIQFGQGQWTVAIGKLSGTLTQPLTLPDGTVHPPTGKSFTTLFTTLARWQNEQMSDVLLEPQGIMQQLGVGRSVERPPSRRGWARRRLGLGPSTNADTTHQELDHIPPLAVRRCCEGDVGHATFGDLTEGILRNLSGSWVPIR